MTSEIRGIIEKEQRFLLQIKDNKRIDRIRLRSQLFLKLKTKYQTKV